MWPYLWFCVVNDEQWRTGKRQLVNKEEQAIRYLYNRKHTNKPDLVLFDSMSLSLRQARCVMKWDGIYLRYLQWINDIWNILKKQI